MKPELKKILGIVTDLAGNDVKKDVLETDIISRSGLVDVEVRRHLNDLEWLHLIKEVQPKTKSHRLEAMEHNGKGIARSL
jgi:hypothetical protein